MLTYKRNNTILLRAALSLFVCVALLATGALAAVASAAPAVFSAAPRVSGRAAISPGGTDQLVFQYNYQQQSEGAVKIDLKIGKAWKVILNTTQSAPGIYTFAWDGKIAGKALRAGTYTARLTMPGATQTIKVRILPKPSVTIYAVKPAKFKATGKSTALIQVRWSQMCDVRVEIVNAAGAVVRTLYTAQNRAAAKASYRWDGKDDQGQLVPSGVYRVRAKCGGAAIVTRKFTVISVASTAPTTTTTTSLTVTLASPPTMTPEQAQSRLVELINGGRQANGLAPLNVNAALSAGALKHSQDMAANNFFDHVSPTAGNMIDRMKAAGIHYWCAGENLALSSSADRAYEQFMGSEGHRANILNANYTDIGVGIVWNSKTSQYVVTVWFDKPQ